jgi:hypothetical protein
MTFTARELVTKSYYLCNKLSRNHETLSGGDLSIGIDLLNDLLAERTVDKKTIPYWTIYSLNTVAGQEEYTIPNLIEVATGTFNIDNVRFSINKVSADRYFGTSRLDNLTSLPMNVNFERVVGGMKASFWPLPQIAYPVKFRGRFALSSVTADTDLSLTYDRYFLVYLRYKLADFMCAEFGMTLLPAAQMQLKSLEKNVQNNSPIDMSMNKRSTFGNGCSLGYIGMQISQGFVPASP